MRANGWVQLGAGVKDIWVLVPKGETERGVEVGLLVGRPGRKECAGREQVGVAELCVWVPRCGENLHVFSGFTQTRATRPTALEGPRVLPQILNNWIHLEPGIPDLEAQELLPSLGSTNRRQLIVPPLHN